MAGMRQNPVQGRNDEPITAIADFSVSEVGAKAIRQHRQDNRIAIKDIDKNGLFGIGLIPGPAIDAVDADGINITATAGGARSLRLLGWFGRFWRRQSSVIITTLSPGWAC
jgi:hypothetical protein